MTDSHFDSPRRTLRWAEEEIEKFSGLSSTVLQKYEPKSVRRRHPVSGAIVVYPQDVKIPPRDRDELEKCAYRIVGDLRNALDQTCHAASIALGSTKPKKTNFPMACNEVDLIQRLKQATFADIPEPLHAVIVNLRPFWEFSDGRKGNVPLRTIGDIANPNKHRAPLSVGFDLNSVGLGEINGIDFKLNPPERLTKPNRPEVHLTITDNNPIISFRFIGRFYLDSSGTFNNIPIAEAFQTMHSVTKEAVDALIAAC